MTRITSISRALVLTDKRSVPARAEKREPAIQLVARPACVKPALRLVPTIERQTSAAGVAIQMTRGPKRRGLKADPNERARYANAYRRTPDLRGAALKISA